MLSKYIPVFLFFALAVGMTLELSGTGITGQVVVENPQLGEDLVPPVGPGWIYESKGESAILMQNGQFSIRFDETSARDLLYYPDITLQPSTTYEVSFMAQSEEGHGVYVSLADDNKVYWNKLVNLDGDFSHYSYELETPLFVEKKTDLRFFFSRFNEPGDVYIISNVVLRGLPENLLRGGSFEGDARFWKEYSDGVLDFRLTPASAGGDVTHGNRAAELTIRRAGSKVYFYQGDILVEPNTRYKISFDAKSNTGSDFLLRFHENTGLGHELGMPVEFVDLSDEWMRYGVEFTSSNAVKKQGRLTFDLSQHDTRGDVYHFDRVVLEKVE